MEFLCQGVFMENHFFTDLTISLKTLFFASLPFKSTRSGGRPPSHKFAWYLVCKMDAFMISYYYLLAVNYVQMLVK